LFVVILIGRGAGASESANPLARRDFLRDLRLTYRDWRVTARELGPTERAELNPDAVLVRQFEATDGAQAELSVIAGRHRRTLHSPGSCLVGCGWERLTEMSHVLSLPSGSITATRALMGLGSQRLLVTYFFTDGSYATPTLLGFQTSGLLRQLRDGPRMQAVIRLIVPIRSSLPEAQALSDDLIFRTVPPVLESIRRAGQTAGADSPRAAMLSAAHTGHP
jgi:EpsI family protein